MKSEVKKVATIQITLSAEEAVLLAQMVQNPLRGLDNEPLPEAELRSAIWQAVHNAGLLPR